MSIKANGKLSHFSQVLITIHHDFHVPSHSHWSLEVFGLRPAVVVPSSNSSLQGFAKI